MAVKVFLGDLLSSSIAWCDEPRRSVSHSELLKGKWTNAKAEEHLRGRFKAAHSVWEVWAISDKLLNTDPVYDYQKITIMVLHVLSEPLNINFTLNDLYVRMDFPVDLKVYPFKKPSLSIAIIAIIKKVIKCV